MDDETRRELIRLRLLRLAAECAGHSDEREWYEGEIDRLLAEAPNVDR